MVKHINGYDLEMTFDVVVVGAGGAGLCAALSARDNGAEVLVLEQDKTPLGTTAMSTGLIPAAGTPEQALENIGDTPAVFASDILRKCNHEADAAVVEHIANCSASTVAWLKDEHDIPLTLVDGFTYPGHSFRRMYGTPNRTGSELMAALERACQVSEIDILTEALVDDLIIDDEARVCGVSIIRPGGETLNVGCGQLILACCGFGGNAEMVKAYIPKLKGAVLHGHPNNKGHAISWGRDLGASLKDMGAYQGHGGLAVGHAVPILWPTMMEGGFQINIEGDRFSNETKGYSEQAENVLAQPDGVAWSVFDQRIYNMMLQFDDFHDALSANAIKQAGSIEDLSETTKTPLTNLQKTFADVASSRENKAPDEFGREFATTPELEPPYYAARVTGALFHTQGGLDIEPNGQVRRETGGVFENLYACGGAARGVSGSGADGYIAGNGLLTATTLGRLAGEAAAKKSKTTA